MLVLFSSKTFLTRLLSASMKIRIYKTMLLAVFCECETWYLTLRENKLQAFENKGRVKYVDLRRTKRVIYDIT